MLSKRNWIIIIINNSNNNNDKLASDLLLITKLTKESYLQSISLKKKNLFKSKNYLHNSFRLKKRHLISIEKIHSKKEKKNS